MPLPAIIGVGAAVLGGGGTLAAISEGFADWLVDRIGLSEEERWMGRQVIAEELKKIAEEGANWGPEDVEKLQDRLQARLEENGVEGIFDGGFDNYVAYAAMTLVAQQQVYRDMSELANAADIVSRMGGVPASAVHDFSRAVLVVANTPPPAWKAFMAQRRRS